MVSPFAVLLLPSPSSCPLPPSCRDVKQLRRQKPPQQDLGDDVTPVPEGISLWIQELWLGCSLGMEASVLRGAEAFLPLPSCSTHKAHYHLKGLQTPSVPRILIYLTLHFQNSLVHPAQSPEGFRVSPQGPLCLERSFTTGTGPCSSAVTKSPPIPHFLWKVLQASGSASPVFILWI